MKRLPIVGLLLVVAACTPTEPAPAPATSPSASPAPEVVAPTPTVTSAAPPAEAPAIAAAVEFPPMEDLVRHDDTLAILQARLGPASAIAEVLPGAEGETWPGWVLYPDQPTRRLEVYLDEQGEHPTSVVANDTATDWVRGDGVRIGLDVAALAALNGRAFVFTGFGWDYGGAVVDWKGGAIAPDGSPPGFVRLCPPASSEPLATNAYPTGDGEFSSDLAVLREHPPTVCSFTLTLPSPR